MEDLSMLDYFDQKTKSKQHLKFPKLNVDFYDDYQFRRRFRMTKESFILLSLIKKDFEFGDKRCNPTSSEVQLMATLRFDATGSFQEVQSDFIGLTQPTISRIVKQVSFAIAKHSESFIKFPTPEETME
ncbi:putative nuclease HARBI1-like protein, partial [Dinothrombium tinctorium]